MALEIAPPYSRVSYFARRASPTRLETKHASDVALETLLPYGAISCWRASGHSGPAGLPNPSLTRQVYGDCRRCRSHRSTIAGRL